MARLFYYCWFVLVMNFTGFLPDLWPILKLRGWLVRPCFKSCGRNFQIASGVRINFTTRLSIGDNTYIASGCWIHAMGTVVLGDEVMLGPYTAISSGNHTKLDGSYRFGPRTSAPVVIGRGSWTAAHTTITCGVTIGEGVVIAAGGVVNKDIEDHCVAGGVPARVLRGPIESAPTAMVSEALHS